MKSIYITLIAFLLFTLISEAQDKKMNYEIGGVYGLSGLSGTAANGSVKPGMGYLMSLNGKYFITSNIGLGIGAGYSANYSNIELNNYSTSITSTDEDGESFELRITADGIKEKQTLSALEIPFFLTFKKNLLEKVGLFGNVGLKFSFPFSAKYECYEGTIETRGFYSAYNIELYNMPNHGFERIENLSFTGDLNTQLSYSFFFNTGLIVSLGKIDINIGGYGSYGLNSQLVPEVTQLIVYSEEYQSAASLFNKISVINRGIYIGFSF